VIQALRLKQSEQDASKMTKKSLCFGEDPADNVATTIGPQSRGICSVMPAKSMAKLEQAQQDNKKKIERDSMDTSRDLIEPKSN
jgi:hypothetical protein